MIRLRYAAALLLAPAYAASAEVPPAPAPAAAAAPTLQVLFNTATETAASGHCDAAIPLFAALAVDPRVKAGSLPAAAIAVRHGRCLMETGAEQQGAALVLTGLPLLEASGEGFAEEVSNITMMLGMAAFRRFDHDAAVTWFTRAAASTDRAMRLQALVRLAQATQFDGDGAALLVIDKAMAELTDKTPDEKGSHANLLALRGRVLMNLGRDKEAAADLRRALDLSGGLTLKASLSDVALRSDLAQAMLLIGKRDEARKYLAYTGAGRIEESPFASATYMGVPGCTGEPGLRPEDSAVVEFAIGTDGQVAGVQTVYSRGTFAAARAFAEEVRDWTWSPASIAKLPPFYRNLIRVELHCSTASGEVGGVLTPLRKAFNRWAGPLAWNGIAGGPSPAAIGEDGERGDAAPVSIARKQVVETLRAAGKRHLAAGETRAAGAAFGLAGMYDKAADGRSLADLTQAIALVTAADPQRSDPATGPALAALRVFQLGNATVAAVGIKVGRSRDAWAKAMEAGLMPGLDDPLITADALALGTLKVSIATLRRAGTMGPDKAALLRAVADDSRLEEGHPLRQIALLRLASVAAAAKQYQEAQALFTKTGLTEQQCALIGDIPRLKSDGATSSDYPLEALRMGFEGWVKVEYDIDAGGRTANQRALIAYPPFVFVDAAKGIARAVRYDPTYRPSGTLACSATSETVRFINP